MAYLKKVSPPNQDAAPTNWGAASRGRAQKSMSEKYRSLPNYLAFITHNRCLIDQALHILQITDKRLPTLFG